MVSHDLKRRRLGSMVQRVQSRQRTLNIAVRAAMSANAPLAGAVRHLFDDDTEVGTVLVHQPAASARAVAPPFEVRAASDRDGVNEQTIAVHVEVVTSGDARVCEHAADVYGVRFDAELHLDVGLVEREALDAADNVERLLRVDGHILGADGAQVAGGVRDEIRVVRSVTERAARILASRRGCRRECRRRCKPRAE